MYKRQVVNVEPTDYGKPSDVTANDGAFKIKTLKHNYDAFSKYIDAKTMYVHFSKHYVGYLNNLNKAVEGKPQANMTIEQLLKTLDTSNAMLRNNAGGYYNHNLYFELMTPNSTGKPSGKLADAINRDFGSFENFKKQFSDAGAKPVSYTHLDVYKRQAMQCWEIMQEVITITICILN